MIADERMHLPPGPRRVGFQAPQQVEHAFRVGPAIEHVTGLDQHGAAAAPAAIAADETRLAQDGDERVKRAVDVANGDDALGRRDVTRRDFGLRRRPRRGQRENGEGGGQSRSNRDVVE